EIRVRTSGVVSWVNGFKTPLTICNSGTLNSETLFNSNMGSKKPASRVFGLYILMKVSVEVQTILTFSLLKINRVSPKVSVSNLFSFRLKFIFFSLSSLPFEKIILEVLSQVSYKYLEPSSLLYSLFWKASSGNISAVVTVLLVWNFAELLESELRMF